MRSITESIIGKRGRIFTAKNLVKGDILVQRNQVTWYYTGKDLEHYNYGMAHPEPSISYDKYFSYTDKDTFKDTNTGYSQYDVVKIYRSGNFIKSVNYNSIEDFIRNNKPIWESN